MPLELGFDKHLEYETHDLLTGEARVKVATQNEIDQFVAEGFKPDPNYLYLHVIAMGAGEYYGCNKNGDYFPERALKIYHKTFETTAKIFKEHDNKEYSKSYGYVAKAYYNPIMHRVELLLAVNKHDAPDIVIKVERGEIPEVSMGCRVPHDVCSICGNKSANKLQYCDHIRHSLKKIMPDGRQAFMLNLQPTFFDISFVFRRADKIALTLKKVATEASSLEHIQDVEKLAEIDKEVPADAIIKILNSRMWDALPQLEAQEQDLPPALLDSLASRHSIEDILSSFSASMIPMKPREFTRIIVVHHGLPMRNFNDVLSGVLQAQPCECQMREPNQNILDKILPYLTQRSSYGPFVGARLLKLSSEIDRIPEPLPASLSLANTPAYYAPNKTREPLRSPMHPVAVGLLLGAMYAAHRGTGNMANIINHINSPKGAAIGTALALALAALFGKSNAVLPSKTASFKGVAGKWVAPFVGVHFLSAHYRNKYNRGEDLNTAEKFIAENPDYLSIAAPFATHYGIKALSKTSAEEDTTGQGADPLSMALLSGIIWRGRGLSGVGGLMDAGIDTALMTTATKKVLENMKPVPDAAKPAYNI